MAALQKEKAALGTSAEQAARQIATLQLELKNERVALEQQKQVLLDAQARQEAHVKQLTAAGSENLATVVAQYSEQAKAMVAEEREASASAMEALATKLQLECSQQLQAQYERMQKMMDDLVAKQEALVEGAVKAKEAELSARLEESLRKQEALAVERAEQAAADERKLGEQRLAEALKAQEAASSAAVQRLVEEERVGMQARAAEEKEALTAMVAEQRAAALAESKVDREAALSERKAALAAEREHAIAELASALTSERERMETWRDGVEAQLKSLVDQTTQSLTEVGIHSCLRLATCLLARAAYVSLCSCVLVVPLSRPPFLALLVCVSSVLRLGFLLTASVLPNRRTLLLRRCTTRTGPAWRTPRSGWPIKWRST